MKIKNNCGNKPIFFESYILLAPLPDDDDDDDDDDDCDASKHGKDNMKGPKNIFISFLRYMENI